MRADLHLHTFYSDGTFSPEEVVQRAKEVGLAAISITDHDTVRAIPLARQAAGDGLEILAGVEMTAAFKDREIHILGYGMRVEDSPFSEFLQRMQVRRLDRIQRMIDRLKSHGMEATLQEVEQAAGRGSVGRPHLAEVMVKRGFVRTLNEAFEKYLGDHSPCFVRGTALTVPRAVELIRQAGGVAVLAHPNRMIEDAWFPELVESGIQGVEVFHPDHNPQVAKRYRKIAQQHRLLVTGGSDCHGLRKMGGPFIGSVTVPYPLVEQLKAAIGSG